MNRVCWWLVSVISQLLEPDEREAVSGDLTELHIQAHQALSEVLGLVVRRQIVLWKDWHPWAALAGLIVPLGMLLSLVSRRTADWSAIYIWLYANNLLRNYGFWHELGHVGSMLFVQYLWLVCLAWTSGFVLGSASRTTARINGVLFCLMLLFGVLLAVPIYLESYSLYLQHTFALPPRPVRSAVNVIFVRTLYSAIFPVIVQVFLVALPSLFGIRQGAGAAKLRRFTRALLWTVSIATVGWVLIQAPGMGLLLNLRRWPGIWQSWEIRLLESLVYWPLLYLAARAIERRWRRRIATA